MNAENLSDLDFLSSIEHGVYVTPESGVTPKFDENLVWLPGMLPGTDDFKPFRLVINLENSGEKKELSFRVYITHSDLRYGVTKLAKWVYDEGSDKFTWKIIPANFEIKNNIPIWAGYFEVIDYPIGDPPIAVG